MFCGSVQSLISNLVEFGVTEKLAHSGEGRHGRMRTSDAVSVQGSVRHTNMNRRSIIHVHLIVLCDVLKLIIMKLFVTKKQMKHQRRRIIGFISQ